MLKSDVTSICGEALLECDWVTVEEDSQVAAQLGHSSLSKQILLSKLIRDLHQRIKGAHLHTHTHIALQITAGEGVS